MGPDQASYLHVEVTHLPHPIGYYLRKCPAGQWVADHELPRYFLVANDLSKRWVFVRIYPAKTAANGRPFLRDLGRTAPIKITRVLT